MSVKYLRDLFAIVKAKRTETPHYGRDAMGYSVRKGAPTGLMIQLNGDNRWRRVYVWQFSNAGTLFVRVNGQPMVIDEFDIPELG